MFVDDKVVCVAGATGHLGSVVVARCAREGASLVLTGRDQNALEALRANLCLPESHCMALAAVATDPQAVSELIREAMARFGRIDVLLNTVGGYGGGASVWETPEALWDEMWTLNLRSCINFNRAVLPHMLAQGWGRIVNVAAKAAVEPRKNSAAYAVSKAGVIALTQSIAAEVKGTGVTANVILPSVIDSPANRESMPSADPSRWVRPAQVAATMLFLCSEEASAINGACLPVYGQMR